MAKNKEEIRRCTVDAILVQAHLCESETYTLRELAHHVFERTSPVCVARIASALHILSRLGRVSLFRAGYSITEARALKHPTAQIDACFYVMVYRAIHNTLE